MTEIIKIERGSPLWPGELELPVWCDEDLQFVYLNRWEYAVPPDSIAGICQQWNNTVRLPNTEPFTRLWFGRSEVPDDWDLGRVLLRNGMVHDFDYDLFPARWLHVDNDYDIIAYRSLATSVGVVNSTEQTALAANQTPWPVKITDADIAFATELWEAACNQDLYLFPDGDRKFEQTPVGKIAMIVARKRAEALNVEENEAIAAFNAARQARDAVARERNAKIKEAHEAIIEEYGPAERATTEAYLKADSNLGEIRARIRESLGQ